MKILDIECEDDHSELCYLLIDQKEKKLLRGTRYLRNGCLSEDSSYSDDSSIIEDENKAIELQHRTKKENVIKRCNEYGVKHHIFKLHSGYVYTTNELGQGTYGTAYKARRFRLNEENEKIILTSKFIAMKAFGFYEQADKNNKKSGLSPQEHQKQITSISLESNIISNLFNAKETPLNRFVEYYDNQDPNNLLIIEMPYISGHSLQIIINRIINNPELYPIEKRIEYCMLAANAIKELHYREKPIIHGDIKPEHFMIGVHENVQVLFKAERKKEFQLIDFGGSKYADDESRKISGSPGYIAAELVNTGITFETDIFQLGIVLISILTSSEEHFRIQKDAHRALHDQLREKRKQCTDLDKLLSELPTYTFDEKSVRNDLGKLNKEVLNCLLELLKKMCSRNPSERYTINEVCHILQYAQNSLSKRNRRSNIVYPAARARSVIASADSSTETTTETMTVTTTTTATKVTTNTPTTTTTTQSSGTAETDEVSLSERTESAETAPDTARAVNEQSSKGCCHIL